MVQSTLLRSCQAGLLGYSHFSVNQYLTTGGTIWHHLVEVGHSDLLL